MDRFPDEPHGMYEQHTEVKTAKVPNIVVHIWWFCGTRRIKIVDKRCAVYFSEVVGFWCSRGFFCCFCLFVVPCSFVFVGFVRFLPCITTV